MIQMKITGARLDEVKEKLGNLGYQAGEITRKRIYSTLLGIRNRLTTMGTKPTYPINWDSEKQRRAFFASNGFGRGIPSRRTGAYSRSWRVVRSGQGYALENPVAYAKYVGGDRNAEGQSRIHMDRWQLWAARLDWELERIDEYAEKEIANWWNE